MNIEILTWEDEYECDTCGSNWAEGGQVIVDDEIVIHAEPIAHCFDSCSFNTEELLIMALKKLGHTVSVNFKEID